MYALSHAGSAAAHYDARFDSPPPLPSRTANQTLHQIRDNHLTASAILRHLRSSDPGSTAVNAELKAQYEAFCEDILQNRHLSNDGPSGAQTLLPRERSLTQMRFQQPQMEQVSKDSESLEGMCKELRSRSLQQLIQMLLPLNNSMVELLKSSKGIGSTPAVLNEANAFLNGCQSRFRTSTQRFGIATEIRNAQRIKVGVDQCLQAFQQLKHLEEKAKLAYSQGYGAPYITAFVKAQSAAANSDMAAFALHVEELRRLQKETDKTGTCSIV